MSGLTQSRLDLFHEILQEIIELTKEKSPGALFMIARLDEISMETPTELSDFEE